jgi:hypothetical protein
MNTITYRDLPRAHSATALDFRSRRPQLASASHASMQRWTWESLSNRIGDIEVRPMVDLPKSGVFDGDYRKHECAMTFGEFARLATSNPGQPCYLAYLRPRDVCAELEADADFSWLRLPNDVQADTRLWIGSAHTNSGLHSDLKDNVFLQVVGRKAAFFVPPEDTKYVYPQPDNIVNSVVDFPAPDIARYPRLARATIYRATVGPGDLVFIPRGWWHCFVALDASISLNHWFGEPVKDSEYLKLMIRQGPRYVGRALVDLWRFGVMKRKPTDSFFFTPPPNGARLYSLLRAGNFSIDNDPHSNK